MFWVWIYYPHSENLHLTLGSPESLIALNMFDKMDSRIDRKLGAGTEGVREVSYLVSTPVHRARFLEHGWQVSPPQQLHWILLHLDLSKLPENRGRDFSFLKKLQLGLSRVQYPSLHASPPRIPNFLSRRWYRFFIVFAVARGCAHRGGGRGGRGERSGRLIERRLWGPCLSRRSSQRGGLLGTRLEFCSLQQLSWLLVSHRRHSCGPKESVVGSRRHYIVVRTRITLPPTHQIHNKNNHGACWPRWVLEYNFDSILDSKPSPYLTQILGVAMPASQSTSKDNQSKEIVFAQIGSLLSTQTRQSFWKWNASYEEELQRPIERDSEAIWGTLLHLVIALAMAQTSWNFMTPLAAMISVSRLSPSTSCDP